MTHFDNPSDVRVAPSAPNPGEDSTIYQIGRDDFIREFWVESVPTGEGRYIPGTTQQYISGPIPTVYNIYNADRSERLAVQIASDRLFQWLQQYVFDEWKRSTP